MSDELRLEYPFDYSQAKPNPFAPSLTAEQRAELARRDAELDANPCIAMTWEQIRASVEVKR